MKSRVELISRRDWLSWASCSCLIAGACGNRVRVKEMDTLTGTIQVKVLAHWLIQKFAGEAILAAANPRFVVALLIANTKMPFTIDGTNLTFATQRVAFFAIDSIVKVFAESDVVGNDYKLSVEQQTIGGKQAYFIEVVQ